MLLAFVILYLLASIAVGLWFARRVKNTEDYTVAGRSLPLSVIIATTFATWFGAETVVGIPAKFLHGGMEATVEDPWGASMCLILVGVFIARKLYPLSLLTINDYYRDRYGKTVELICSVVDVISYLGWVAAQVTALGVVFNLLTDDWISTRQGAFLGTAIVLLYTVYGGMWSVAVTDFMQMIIIVLGLAGIAVMSSNLAGGPAKVFEVAQDRDLLRFFPAANFHDIIFFIGAGITIMFGSIPQQDIFQRIMSAKDARTATWGPIIGGTSYLLFAFVPMFIVVSSLIIMPAEAEALLTSADDTDSQKVLPTLIIDHMPQFAQVMFFGALLSAIMSTASATILAPSTVFVQNIVKHFRPGMSDQHELRMMRLTVLVFTVIVFSYALAMEGTSVFDMVSTTYQLPVVGAFVPLVAGLYWKRATNQGAILSIALGVSAWILFMVTPLGEMFPQQLAGLLMAIVGMVVGSHFFGEPARPEPVQE
jgi:SSS family solute:Na+ symporter